MEESIPNARSSRFPGEREKLKRLIAQRGLAGLASDTKWNELITAMRSRKEWRPAYRFKCIDGPPAAWDREWFYDLPFPFLSVEWFDIAHLQEITIHRLPIRKDIIDHSTWIEPLLRDIGLDYRGGSKMFRVFGYFPRDLELFDQ
jgi:hypothetical protein